MKKAPSSTTRHPPLERREGPAWSVELWAELVSYAELAGQSVLSLLQSQMPDDTVPPEAAFELLAAARKSRPCRTAVVSEDARRIETRPWPEIADWTQVPYPSATDRILRLCIVTPALPGPQENDVAATISAALAHTVAAAQHRVTVLCTQDSWEPGAYEYWSDYYRGFGIELVRLTERKGRWYPGPKVAQSYVVYEQLRGTAFDLVYFLDSGGVGYYSLLGRSLGLDLTDTAMTVVALRPTRWRAEQNGELLATSPDLHADFMEQRSAELADAVVSPSPALFEWMKERQWKLPEKCLVLPLPPAKIGMSGRLKAKPLQHTEIVFYGRLESLAGVELFCDALDELMCSDATPCQITFLGEDGAVHGLSGADYIRRRAVRWSWAWNIRSNLSRREELDYLASHPALVAVLSPVDRGQYELHDCLALGVPFLASAGGSARRIVAAEDHPACLVPPVARAVAKAIKEAVGRRMQPQIRPRHSPGDIQKMWLALADQIVLGRTPAPKPVKSAEPLVSICIPTRNRTTPLALALRSIFEQEYRNSEILIVDDGSDDPAALKFLSVIESLQSPLPIKVIRSGHNWPGGARNLAALHARGRYLLFFDSDNYLKPEAIRLLVQAAESSRLDFAPAFFEEFIGPEEPARTFSNTLFLGPAISANSFINCVGDTFTLVRRDSFLTMGGFTEGGDPCEDQELYGSAVLQGYRLEVVPHFLLWYRRNIHSHLRSSSLYRGIVRALRPYQHGAEPLMKDLFELGAGLVAALEGTICVNPSQAASAEERFLSSTRTLLALDRSTGFETVEPLSEVQLLQNTSTLILVAKDSDPTFVLPPLPGEISEPLLVHFRIEAPSDTQLEVFYRTPDVSYFSQSNSVACAVRKGLNEVYLELPAATVTGNLRVDPGMAPGRYRIDKIEVRAADYE